MKMKWVLQSLLLLLLVANLGCQSTVDPTRQDAWGLATQPTDPDYSLFLEAQAKAAKGDAEAQYKLYEWYANGQRFASHNIGYSISKNDAEARKWLNLASAQGYDKAKTRLLEIKQIEAKQRNLFENTKANADQGDVSAQYNLGEMYRGGRFVPRDIQEAVKWYRKAAEQGYAKAQYSLGFMYADAEVSLPKWSNEAVRKHFGQFNGVDVMPQNYAEGAKWYRKAAEQGNADGQRNLGVMYGNGDGVPQDYVEAYKWSNLAAAQGDTIAKENRDFIVRFMMPEQVAEAQQSARNFVPCKESSSDNPILSNNPRFSGTGFFITDNGYLISNYHVVKDATKVRLLTSAGLIDAKVVQTDAANDLALLKADGRFAPLPIAASRTVNLGGTVATIGFPNIGMQGFSPKLAKGEIASLSGAADDPRYFQISVPVQPGNSGGALVDEHGNVIGVVSAKLNASVALAASGALPENVNYAVKSSFLLSFLESVPAVSAKLKEPVTADRKFEDVVKSAQDAAVLVLVY
jgi:uncharacterized protein